MTKLGDCVPELNREVEYYILRIDNLLIIFILFKPVYKTCLDDKPSPAVALPEVNNPSIKLELSSFGRNELS